ncbi:uncharacterized protein [Montipora capricornis]|uniref:uncharacterized protein isoform X1 n=1 Tax=Montipora capricornis TaxID=246305 RepID=UPI0035F122C4
MKLRTLRLRVAIAAIVLWIFVIVAHVCIVSQLKDFSTDAMFKSMLPQELLLFQESGKLLSDDQVVDVRVTDVRRSLVGLNHHIWKGNCVRKIETLCNFPMFPKAPDQRKVIYRTEITEPKNATTDGHRFIGFLIPYTSGEYNFAVASNGIAEVWLSDSENWKMAKQIAFVRPLHQNSASFKQWDFNVSRTQISSGIHLKASVRYYIEMSYTFGTQNTVENFVQVAWKRSQESNFSVIEGRSLSLYTNDSELAKYKIFDDKLPDAASCDSKIEKGYYNTHMSIDTTIPYLQHTAVNQALLLCQYQPSYVLDCSNLTSFKQYDGVKRHVQRTYAYPFPVVDGSIRLRRGSNFYYEFPLDEEEALSIVSKYMEALETTYFGRYNLVSIKRVEKKIDLKKGLRYFLELVVSDTITGKNFILAEYAFQPKGENVQLFYPEGLQWNRTADVYLILTAKNLGRWVHHFIKNVEKIFKETRDEHLHVIIYDFDSPDINLEQALRGTVLKNYHYIRKPGKYSRTISYTEAIASVKDPNAIVVTIDLHLDLGSQFINEIRKHCLKGKTVYAPDIVFLRCGGSSLKPKGFWYHYSYGTIAMYKEDWDIIGGFSASFSNKTTWGAEDWDLIDSAIKGGLEIERIRSPWMYHYYHTKDGMWQ